MGGNLGINMPRSSSMERRSFLKATGSAAAAAALAGCSSDSDSDGTEDEAGTGDGMDSTDSSGGDVGTDLKEDGDLWRVNTGTMTTMDRLRRPTPSQGSSSSRCSIR